MEPLSGAKAKQSHFIAIGFKFHGLEFPIHHQKACESFTIWALNINFFFWEVEPEDLFLEPKDLNDLPIVCILS